MPTRSFLFDQPPRWTIRHLTARHQFPIAVQSWVYERHSLTERLRRFYGQAVAVKILYQQQQAPFVDECQLLQHPLARHQVIREVLLHVEGKPLILARTVLPHATIRTAKRQLSHLGTRPLGEVIFSYPTLQRLATQVCCLSPPQWTGALQQQVTIQNSIWGRRTVYAIAQQPLLVSEFFLPAALRCLERVNCMLPENSL